MSFVMNKFYYTKKPGGSLAERTVRACIVTWVSGLLPQETLIDLFLGSPGFLTDFKTSCLI